MSYNRKVVSTRMKPAVLEKLDCLVNHYNIDTSWWGDNKHTAALGYWRKRVTRSDVIEILITKAFDNIQNTLK